MRWVNSEFSIPDEEDELIRDYLESRSRIICSVEDRMLQQMKEKEIEKRRRIELEKAI